MTAEEIQAGLRDAEVAPRLAALAELAAPEADPAPWAAEVASCLDHPAEAVRAAAVCVLARLGASSVAALDRAVRPDQPPVVRTFAAQALGTLGPAAVPAIRELCRALTAPDPGLRFHAALALGSIGEAASPWLHRMLQFSDPLVVAAAVDGLGWIGKPAAHAVPDIQRLGCSPVAKLRQSCAAALVKIARDPAAGLPILERELVDPDPEVRQGAIERIGELGAAGRPAASGLLRCVRDPVAGVRAAAALALARLHADAASALPALEQLLGDAESAVRVTAAVALGAYGPEARGALPALEALRRGPDDAAGAAAAAAIGAIGGGVP